MVPSSPRWITMMLILYNYLMFNQTNQEFEEEDLLKRLGIRPTGYEKWIPADHYLSKFGTFVTLVTATMAIIPVVFPRRNYALNLIPLIGWNLYELMQYIIHVLMIYIKSSSTYFLVACIIFAMFHGAMIAQAILYHEVLNHVFE